MNRLNGEELLICPRNNCWLHVIKKFLETSFTLSSLFFFVASKRSFLLGILYGFTCRSSLSTRCMVEGFTWADRASFVALRARFLRSVHLVSFIRFFCPYGPFRSTSNSWLYTTRLLKLSDYLRTAGRLTNPFRICPGITPQPYLFILLTFRQHYRELSLFHQQTARGHYRDVTFLSSTLFGNITAS